MDVHSRHTHPRWRAGDGSNSEVTLVSECHSGEAGHWSRHLVTCDQSCAPPPHTVRRHRSNIETHIWRERYCVKLLVGVGRGDAVAAWPSHDCTPLKEPIERLVRDHRRPGTLQVLPSDSISQPYQTLRIRISSSGINKQTHASLRAFTFQLEES
jgi:hypothetical protein